MAEEAAGCSVDLLVTDRPEWKERVERVPTSLESYIEANGVVLADGGQSRVNWDKEMVLPMSDFDEALRRFRETGDSLENLSRQLDPGRIERIAMESADGSRWAASLQARLAYACAAVHLTVETSIKALVHLHSCPTGPVWGHDLGRLCDQVAPPRRREVMARLEPVGPARINAWRHQTRYGHTSGLHEKITAELAREMVRIA